MPGRVLHKQEQGNVEMITRTDHEQDTTESVTQARQHEQDNAKMITRTILFEYIKKKKFITTPAKLIEKHSLLFISLRTG